MRRKSFLWIGIIVIIIIAVIIIINVIKKNDVQTGSDEFTEEIEQYEQENTGKVQNVDNIVDYNTVRTCLKKFYNYYSFLYDEEIINRGDEEQFNLSYYKEQVFNLLNSEYIEKNGITIDNIDSKLRSINYSPDVEILNIYYYTKFDNINTYFVNGLIRNTSNNESEEFSAIVYLDLARYTFEVNFDSIDFNSIYNGNEINISYPSDIFNKEINTYSNAELSYDEFSNIIFNNIQKLLVYNTDIAYELLDDTGKNDYTLDSLEEYVNNNRKEILLLTFKIYEFAYEDENLVIYMYDENSEYEFKVTFNDFSNYKFSFSRL